MWECGLGMRPIIRTEMTLNNPAVWIETWECGIETDCYFSRRGLDILLPWFSHHQSQIAAHSLNEFLRSENDSPNGSLSCEPRKQEYLHQYVDEGYQCDHSFYVQSAKYFRKEQKMAS